MIRAHLEAGLAAARQNLIPGLILQGALIAMLVGWSISPSFRATLDAVAGFKVRYGYGYSFVAGAIASGVLPEILKIATFQRGRPHRENLVSLVFGVLFWGAFGVLVDAFYRVQGAVFGPGADLATVASKVAVDMFVFTPLLSAPLVTIAYAWKHGGFRVGAIRHSFTPSFYRDRVLPVLFPNWALWIPIVSVIYDMPAGLQIPIWAVAMAFWTLLLATITFANARATQAV